MDSQDFCTDSAKDKKKKKPAEKGGRRSKTFSAVKVEDEMLSNAAYSDVVPKSEFDESLLQHNVFTEILNMKKKELLESDVLINSLFPFKKEKE